MKILIVEDEQRARKGLKNLIYSLSEEYEIVGEASNGISALEQIQLLKPDVVLTDIQIPFMNGIELIRAARAQSINVNFVVISAYAEFSYAQQAISLGVSEYLLKPVNKEEVQKVLERITYNKEKKVKYNWEKNETLHERYHDKHPLILKVINIIENGYAGKINQKELAVSLGVSPEYLSYLFKKETGENFAKFLRNYRIEIAKKLLLNPDIDTSEIPFIVGFTDAKYFHKVFRDTVGVSVNQYIHDR